MADNLQSSDPGRRQRGFLGQRLLPDNLLQWGLTPSRPRDDYTGIDPARPRLYARVYLPTGAASPRPWYWVLAGGAIASGYEETVEAAVDAAERSYARWLKEH
jgi:hypothetical protein